MLLAVCGPETSLVEVPAGVREEMVALSRRFEPESYVYMIMVLEDLRRNVRFSSLGRTLVEAAVVRLASSVSYRSIQSLINELSGSGTASPGPGAAASRPAAGGASPPAAPVRSAAGVVNGSAETSPRPGAAVAADSGARPAARSGRSAPASPPPVPVSRPTRAANSDDVKQAKAEPIVREALDLFGGTLVNVERAGGGQPAGPGDDSGDSAIESDEPNT